MIIRYFSVRNSVPARGTKRATPARRSFYAELSSISIIYLTRAATVRAGPLLDTCLATLPAGLVAGATTTGAGDGTGPGAAVTFDGAFAAAILAFVIPPVTMRADIAPSPTANRAAKALLSITERTVTPATSAAEGTVIGNLSRAAAAGAIPVTGDHTGKQGKCRQQENKRKNLFHKRSVFKNLIL